MKEINFLKHKKSSRSILIVFSVLIVLFSFLLSPLFISDGFSFVKAMINPIYYGFASVSIRNRLLYKEMDQA